MLAFALSVVLFANSTPRLDFTLLPPVAGQKYEMMFEVEAESKVNRKFTVTLERSAEPVGARDLVESQLQGWDVKVEGLTLVIVGHKGSPTRKVVVTSDGIAPAVVWAVRPKK